MPFTEMQHTAELTFKDLSEFTRINLQMYYYNGSNSTQIQQNDKTDPETPAANNSSILEITALNCLNSTTVYLGQLRPPTVSISMELNATDKRHQ